MYLTRVFVVRRWHCGLEIMASIETVVQNADVETGDDSKPDSTAELKEEPGEHLQQYLIVIEQHL